MSSVKLEWASAEVKNAGLTVPLDGKLPDGWSESFERTVKLLGDGEWGEVALKKGKVRVSEVSPGTEEKLRHHLEAIVAQANAHLQHAEREAQQARDGDDRGGKNKRSGPDAEMTERFRSFQEDDADGEH